MPLVDKCQPLVAIKLIHARSTKTRPDGTHAETLKLLPDKLGRLVLLATTLFSSLLVQVVITVVVIVVTVVIVVVN